MSSSTSNSQSTSTSTSVQSSREGSCESEIECFGSESPTSTTKSSFPQQQQPQPQYQYTPQTSNTNLTNLPEALKSRVLDNTTPQSDAECWERMLELQKEYHCYQSARLEAAVDALENGWRIEEVVMPSRLCLDLLNDGLKARIRADLRG